LLRGPMPVSMSDCINHIQMNIMSSSVTRALVVGGTGGIGYGIACRIAAEARSSTVIISGRTKPESIPHANIEFRKLDASSMRAIKAYTDAYKSAQEPKLDLLVLTQGIMTIVGRTETPEGIDRKMALHYYGRQLLIRELIPVLKDDAKVVIVLDSLYGSPAKLNWEDLDLKKTFSIGNAANHCISMNDAMVQQYAAQQQQQQAQSGNKRHFVHANPGIVKTNLNQELPWFLRSPTWAVGQLLGVSPETCAENLLKGTYECAASGEKEGRFWSCINGKGHLVGKKAVWGDEQRQKVADHTWKIIDDVIGAEK
jgi:NAD(P)-dependent dehydrogenase (short-subunit alcohol dehydrogenase family)